MDTKMKKNFLSMQLNVDDFAPASVEEKESLVIMRESVSFWKDGMRRFRRNKIAMSALIVVIIIMIFCFIVPFFYPYKYEQILICLRESQSAMTPIRSYSSDPVIFTRTKSPDISSRLVSMKRVPSTPGASI